MTHKKLQWYTEFFFEKKLVEIRVIYQKKSEDSELKTGSVIKTSILILSI